MDIDYGGAGDYYFAWAGDESNSIMHYLDLASGFIEAHTPMINDNEAMLQICKFHNAIVGH